MMSKVGEIFLCSSKPLRFQIPPATYTKISDGEFNLIVWMDVVDDSYLDEDPSLHFLLPNMSTLKLLFYVLFLLSFVEAQDPFYFKHNCSTNKTFTPNSSYQLNLNTALSSLSAATAKFYNTTAVGRSSYDTVYGLFMCRGDVPLGLCIKCVQNATQRISAECGYSKEAIIWYAECMVRYSNRSIFSTLEEIPLLDLVNTANISNQVEGFDQVLANTLLQVAAEASGSDQGGANRFFGTKEANLTATQTLYTLAQCTPDLSSQDCNKCLRDLMGSIPWCCVGKQGGRLLFPSCNLGYELYPFYGSNTFAPLPTTPPPSSQSAGKRGNKSRTIILVIVLIVVLMICFGSGCYFLHKRRKIQRTILQENFGDESATLESLQFSLGTIEAATNKFSHQNRIGKGGFGEVYKGVLSDGRDIAVKRLSTSSGQGVIEFKNEVLLIAKLQHRNLVALLGFCLEGQEKMLIYEYVPNKSLDNFLFGVKNKRLLNWSERYQIIGGIIRGMLYLHDHSRLKIIHRDLKPSNILLDVNMNPKISDFGMARIVSITETHGNTSRIVGTYGYMSPEYAMLGKFSEKSDVFSFGVVILEIISGKRNATSYEPPCADALLSSAWKLWRDETPLEILDPNLEESYSPTEVTKCIQIGLLCVQENPDARPSMSEVVSYLSSHSIELPFPQQPAFFMHGMNMGRKESSSCQSTNNSIKSSVNDISLTTFFPR